MALLKFAAFSSDVELPFYTSLASSKIDHDKLDDSARRVLGLYEIRPAEEPGVSCRLQLHGNALTGDDVPNAYYRAEGIIKNVNTIEDYKALDKTAILNQAGRTVWEAIKDGSIYSCPSLLASFCMICYADLKKYKFTYLFGFPAIHLGSTLQIDDANEVPKPGDSKTDSQETRQHLSGDETTSLVDSVQTWRYSVDARQHGFFLAKRVRGKDIALEQLEDGQEPPSYTPASPITNLGFRWVIAAIEHYEQGFFDTILPEDRFICFADPSTYPTYPSWILRNFLVLMKYRWKLEKAQILCYRDLQARRHEARSLVLQIRISDSTTNSHETGSAELENSDMPKITGWEKNTVGKFASKIANLGEYMDPQRLADQAVDLNLKLIKWRISPNLDLESVKSTSCLLLGAGTLGSYVARNLMGWGVRKITFVDNGSVSFSNPVRQPLFNFDDCLAGGVKKAPRAAEALKEIYPGVVSRGHVLSVPMAGHPVIDSAKVRAEFEQLRSLIKEHDVIFLLMDTRESRWLPTLMGRSAGKLVMNAALGFDTFVVMRHGVQDLDRPDDELGCYFCNDVVAPADSMTDRTLDQQCTVTRPGIAAIASALLVEITVSILQHKDGARASAPLAGNSEQGDHPLGIVPHQIRGFLSSFQNIVTHGKRYNHCSACSEDIVRAYSQGGWEFIEKALNNKGYVEEISGLAEIQRAAELAASQVDWDEDSGAEAIDSDGEVV